MKVTIFKNIKSTSSPFYRGIEYVLGRIREGKSRELVDQIRFEVEKEKQNELKQQLPSICFSGTFKNRSISGLKQHSGLICLDFDKFESEDDLIAARDTLIGDPYVFALFRSPSYSGLKTLVRVPAKADMHKSYFDALGNYFAAIPGFDKATSDVSRVCYESYDPELYHNPESQLWVEGEEVDLTELGTTEPVLPLDSENRIVQNLLKWWERKYGRKKGERNTNAFKLAVALHDFGVPKTEATFVLDALEETDFTKPEIAGIINSAYKNDATFATRYFEDYSKRRNIEKQILNGKSVKQVKEMFPEIKDINQVAERIKDTIVIDEFWTYNDKGTLQVVAHKFKRYIQNNFIFKYFPNQEADPVFIQINENKVSIVTRTHIKDMVLKELEQRHGIGMMPFDAMADKPKYFSDDYLSFLDTVDISLKKDTIDTGYLYYRDRVLEIKAGSLREIEYIDLNGFVWEKQIIDRNFKKAEGANSVFHKFVWLISGQDQSRFDSIRSTIGYLMHSYKNLGNNKAIILNDEVISENPNGGSGKGIYSQAIGKVKNVSVLDGKIFDPNKSFSYQTAAIDTQILVFDDVKKNFAFESIFSLITEGITYERKNKDAIKLPIQDSPKVLISTNYTIGGIGGSFERRKHEIEFSNYFGAHHTPFKEFGHMLFDDWNDEEMNLFDNFMVECLQLYLREGLIEFEQKNLKTRKFIKDTCQEFYEWCEDGNIQVNTRLYRTDLRNSFLEEYKDQEKFTSSKRFTKWLEAYAVWKDYEYKEGREAKARWSYFVGPTTDSSQDDWMNQSQQDEQEPFTLF